MATTRTATKATLPPRPRSNMEAKAALIELLSELDDVETLIVTIKGKEIEFQYRSLGWLAKSECLSLATDYKTTGERDSNGDPQVKAVFHIDVWKAEVLKRILVDPPIPITDQLLARLPEEVGIQFDSIIPSPMSLEAVGEMGKASGSFSEE